MKDTEIATVGDLIEYLKKNFKPNDRLCYWHEGGAWMECEYVDCRYFGSSMFFRVEDDLKRRGNSDTAEHEYRIVERNDVVIY